MSFILISQNTGAVVGPFESEKDAGMWALNNQEHDNWTLTVLVLPEFAPYVQRIDKTKINEPDDGDREDDCDCEDDDYYEDDDDL